MENESLLGESWKALRYSKWVWLFAFIFYASSRLLGISSQKLEPLSLCGLELIWLILFLACPLAITITLYHGFLGKPASLAEILGQVRQYAFRWLRLFILVYIPVGVIFQLVWRSAPTINFILFTFVAAVLSVLFITFFVQYAQLGLISRELGVVDALKHAARVWAMRPGTKLAVTLAYAMTSLVLGLFVVAAQAGLSMQSLFLSEQQYTSLLKSPTPALLVTTYDAISTTILSAITMSIYFRDAQVTPISTDAVTLP